MNTKLLLLGLALPLSSLFAQTLTFTNTTRGGSAYFEVGDSFQLNISGAANAAVTYRQTFNGVPGGPYSAGSTNSSGSYSLSATTTSGSIGTWTEIWYVGGVQATPTLSFTVLGPPTVTLTNTTRGGTTYYPGDNLQLDIAGGLPNASVSYLLALNNVSQGSFSAGTSDSSGSYHLSATISADPADVGTNIETWSVGGITATPQLTFTVVGSKPGLCAIDITNGCPTVKATSLSLWYFGGQSPGGNYSVTNALVVVPTPGDTNPNPVISWSVDNPSLVQLVPYSSQKTNDSANITSLAPSYTSHQGVLTYNIHITVTYDGVASDPVPLFINTPLSANNTNQIQYCNQNGCDCAAFYPGRGWQGYATLIQGALLDILGNQMQPVILHETLEQQRYLAAAYISANQSGQLLFPSASTWTIANWNSNKTFNDYYSFCAAPTGQLAPPVTSSGEGNTQLFNETQKYWIGVSGPGFLGSCVQRDVARLYTDHGAMTDIELPGIPSTICNQGNFSPNQ